jgi:hypothetical protein
VTAVALEAPVAGPEGKRSEDRLFEPSEVTLEDSILDVWEALDARGRAECPVCSATIAPTGCAGCGSRLLQH